MPGRNGHAAQGGWESGHNIINGTNYPTDLVLTNRNNSTPTEYKATNSIEFTDGFNDNGVDEYTAFIVDGSTTSNGTAGGSGVDVGGGYRYGFNGQEHSDDVTEGNYTAEFWEYDSRIGRRWNIDPKPNVRESPYLCFSNNPIIYSDLLGDTTYRFNMKGLFLGMSNLDKKGIMGEYGNMVECKTSKGKKSSVFIMEDAFLFNDPDLDKKQLDGMKVGDKGLTFFNDENLNAIMKDAMVKKGSIDNVYPNSKTKGLWDFSSSYLLPALGIDPNKKVPEGDTKGGFIFIGNKTTAYNINDAGNWLWGQAMSRTGIPLGIAKSAAHFNSIVNDKAGWDSKSDQNAIGSGYIYKVVTKDVIYNRIFLAAPIKQNSNSSKQWGH